MAVLEQIRNTSLNPTAVFDPSTSSLKFPSPTTVIEKNSLEAIVFASFGKIINNGERNGRFF